MAIVKLFEDARMVMLANAFLSMFDGFEKNVLADSLVYFELLHGVKYAAGSPLASLFLKYLF